MDFVYHVVDVFTQQPLAGNPLAVFPDARGLDAATMQRIARELNLSETTFVLPAKSSNAAAHVRIFTPASEMQFAGHPTIGTAFVLRRVGRVPADATDFAFEEGVGPVAVRVEPGDDPMIWLTTPPIEQGATFDRARCARALGLDADDVLADVPCRILSAGNPNLYVALASTAAVDRAQIDVAALETLFANESAPVCLFAFAPAPYGAYSRMFAPALGVPEDPATGSATGPLAAFMMEHGLAPATDGTRFVSEQGTKMGRRSLLHVLIHGERGCDAIEVGGHVTPLATATMTLR
ncbi:MAG TPA: PhzF family phenazine biosynthesis protein [Candidatus Elarobacter sp.]|nr:PhzF family phenazine biosynthesis protein [Candidatus Elarobacter sp.]HEV2738396.1 PhzF family phenazine biosynthesis protein [Candidatus Elarobacter sp.]